MTRINVSMKPTSKTKPFREFDISEFLVAEQTGFLGIKISVSSIQYIGNAVGSTQNTIATQVNGDKFFLVPTAVDILVAR